MIVVVTSSYYVEGRLPVMSESDNANTNTNTDTVAKLDRMVIFRCQLCLEGEGEYSFTKDLIIKDPGHPDNNHCHIHIVR